MLHFQEENFTKQAKSKDHFEIFELILYNVFVSSESFAANKSKAILCSLHSALVKWPTTRSEIFIYRVVQILASKQADLTRIMFFNP